ncbi:MAG: DUF3822 family protein [Muribaculaceae bacterium]|nr:DUF3822 family protein [Muribaculaceae bacterium]
MTRPALTRELIADPTLWRLILRIGGNRLSALLIGPESAERSVMSHTEELPDDTVRSLENAVYDNPLLLSEFAAVDVVFATREFFLAPESALPLTDEMAEAMLPDACVDRRIECESFGPGALCYAVAADVCNFVARTFASAVFHHALAVDARYLAHRNREASDSAHLYALCEGVGEMAAAAFDGAGRLRYLNAPSPVEPSDFAYYILAAARGGVEPLSVGGTPELRNAVCDVLRAADPDARVLPLTLPEDLLHLRRLAPELPFDMLFLTRL